MLALLVVLIVFAFSFQSLFCKLYTQNYKGSDSDCPVVFSTVYGLIIGIATFAYAGFKFAPSLITVVFGVINSITLFGYNFSLVEAAKKGPYSFLNISMLVGGIIIPMISGMLFFDSWLNGWQIFAIVIMLSASVVMNIKGFSLKGSSGMYYIWCAVLFLTNGIYGSLLDAQQTLMKQTQRSEMLIISFIGLSILSFAYLAVRNGKKCFAAFKTGKKALIYMLISGISATFAANLLVYLLNKINAAVLFTLDNGGVLILSMVYSAIIFKEKPDRYKYIGAFMALIGIIILSLV